MVSHEIGVVNLFIVIFFFLWRNEVCIWQKKGKKGGKNPTVKRLKGISSFLGIEQHIGLYKIMYKLL